MSRVCFSGTLVLTALVPVLLAGADAKPTTPIGPSPQRGLKSESFDTDPGWEGYNNRLVPKVIPVIKQDYGYSGETQFASKQKGEIGGKVVRCAKPNYYAAPIAAGRTL